MSTYRNYYDTSYSRNPTKKDDDKSTTSRIASKYGGLSYQRDTPIGNYGTRKSSLDKKETSHPPVSYRGLSKTGARSRDPSPVDKSASTTSSSSTTTATTSSSSSNYNYNRLYPKTYSRSVSKERLESPAPTTTIPKYTGRTSLNKDDALSKYTASRSSLSREDLAIPKYSGRSSITKEDLVQKYTLSREDLTPRYNSTNSQKYITSRFLPKNTIEKSYTAYTRPSTLRTNETSRKNRELLNVLHAQQEQERCSRPASRCSSTAPDDYHQKTDTSSSTTTTTTTTTTTSQDIEKIEMETVSVVTRGTSPTPITHTSRPPRRIEIAKIVEKQLTRPKYRVMVDKEIQSDRLDDTTKNSRFSGAARLSTATPWSSFLDMKFTSPSDKKSESPKSISRASSTKSLNQSNGSSKSSKSQTKSKMSPPKPPQVPKNDSNTSKSASLHSIQTLNKDFRKSVLNMSPENKLKTKFGKHSASASSADSESDVQPSEATDISENFSSCKSYHKTSSASKLPQRIQNNSSKSIRNRRSPSSDVSTSSSNTEDDKKARTSANVSSTDELSLEKSPKPPPSPRLKSEHSKNEVEAKSFLMRALAPVTNLFKRQDSGEKAWWLDDTTASTSLPKDPEPSPKSMQRVESGEKSWWLDDATTLSTSLPKDPAPGKTNERIESGEKAWWLEEASKRSDTPPKSHESQKKPLIRHVESGEIPWWLDENAEVPEGVETYPNYKKDEDSQKSNVKCWWLDSSESQSSNNNNKNNSKNSEKLNIMDEEYLERYKIRHIDSGERAWWLSSSENVPEMVQAEEVRKDEKPKFAIRHIDSGEKPWWLQDNNNNNDFDTNPIPLGDRASPEGLEMPRENEGRLSPYDNLPTTSQEKQRKKSDVPLFISKHRNIDEILGGGAQMWRPLIDQIFGYSDDDGDQTDNGGVCMEVDVGQVKIHDSTPQHSIIQPARIDNIGGFPTNFSTYSGKLDDAALQLYKDGDYGSYLDLEASISEQQEEFEGFQSNKKNSIVLRTQLSVRVHTIIEKLLTSEGRELRRALFSLKQIFQEDKDLVHEFVQNDGLSCLIKVGSEADQNYQNYILRALGQVMLYVDGMNGVIEHNQTIQWLYSLISSKFRLVVKTALKLLLVFVEYTDTNCMLLIKAIQTVDCTNGALPWHNIMKLLKDFDSADTELLIYATTLINKVLNGIPDQDTYYDQTDALEEQNIEMIIQRYMSKPGTDLDLLQQFQIYEAVLQYEDGEENSGTPIRILDENIRKTLKNRKSVNDSTERRKSRRHSTGTAPPFCPVRSNNNNNNNGKSLQSNQEDDDDETSTSQSSGFNNSQINGSYKDCNKATDAGVTPALRRRRERAERQRSFMKEQQESVALLKGTPIQNGNDQNEIGNYTNALQQRINNGNVLSRKDLTPLMNAVNKLESEESLTKQPWILSMMYNNNNNNTSNDDNNNNNSEHLQQIVDDTIENTNDTNDRNVLLQLKRENTVKDLTQKLANQTTLQHNTDDNNKINRIGDMTGLISKAKEGLAKSKSKVDLLKSPTNETKLEPKKSENELRWEELMASLNRPLNLCDMDFTDLLSDDDNDILAPAAVTIGVPPPPPPLLKENGVAVAPPPPPFHNSNNSSPLKIPPPVPNPPIFGGNLQKLPTTKQHTNETKIPIKKNKKTVKLFWKEVRDDPISNVKLKSGSIWDELKQVVVDTQKLEHLFESRAKDLITKKQQEMNKNKEIIVLDPKRSNAINIGMTKLPPPRSIKTAILKMDATIMNREGIEKLLTMLPTEEERSKIQEAQAANPDLPLGSAEQFLLTLASISELPARLKLWAFKLDFENSEREIAEPLMDLKHGIEILRCNKTFRGILSTLLSIGNFLNGNEVKGFQIDYLAKVPEVKDTVHKHSLLHHLCHIVMEKFPDATDLYSEIGALTRASKIDFDELALNIQRLEADCKASWDHLKLIAKHDGSTMMKVKMSDFLSDCAERIILVGIIHRRVMNRFHKFLLWLGIPLHQITDTKPNEFCRIISEFALEYRTTRERVLQQLEKKANHRERNKTRGKMITDVGKFRTKEDRADAELRQLLGSDISDVESMQGTLPWRRTRRESNRSLLNSQVNGNLTDGDDEILETLVKTATKGPTSRTAPRERKRTRHADRKSLKRSRTRENNPFGSRDSP